MEAYSNLIGGRGVFGKSNKIIWKQSEAKYMSLKCSFTY